jgi:hypothetical protein
MRPVRRVAELGSLGVIHTSMGEVRVIQPLSEDSRRRYFRFVRIFRLLSFALAIVIGFWTHWSGLAWIPIGILLVLAIFGFVAGKACDVLFRIQTLYCLYWLARDYARMSPADRELLLSQMDPDFREYFLNWIKKP